MKICGICKNELSLDKFYPDKRSLDKLEYCCKVCSCNKRWIRRHDRNQRYCDYKRSEVKRGYKFDLDKEQFFCITSKPCVYCGKFSGIDRFNIGFTGIDRIDNDIGYYEFNCVPCCTKCNDMKGTMSVRDFLHKIKEIIIHDDEQKRNLLFDKDIGEINMFTKEDLIQEFGEDVINKIEGSYLLRKALLSYLSTSHSEVHVPNTKPKPSAQSKNKPNMDARKAILREYFESIKKRSILNTSQLIENVQSFERTNREENDRHFVNINNDAMNYLRDSIFASLQNGTPDEITLKGVKVRVKHKGKSNMVYIIEPHERNDSTTMQPN